MELKSLAERCLQVILENFDRFSHAFNATEDPILKRNFEFLQRCYSNEMMQVISKQAVVNEDYFPLLINKHLREFNLGLLDRIDGETMVRMIAEVGEGLVNVSFSALRNIYHLDPPYADIFPHLKNVTILNMEKTCNDEVLKHISKYCPNLVDLNIAYSLVTNAGIKNYLCQKNDKNEVPNSKLRTLILDGTNISDDQTELILKSFPNLEVLDSPGMPCILHKMHQDDIVQNNTCDVRKYKITHLETMCCEHLATFPELIKWYVLLCPEVTVLFSTVLNLNHLKALAEFQKLKFAALKRDSNFFFPDINNFLNCRGDGLVVLYLTGFVLSVEKLIKNCPLLEELHLQSPFFEGFVQSSSNKFKFLRTFYLEGVDFSFPIAVESVTAIISSSHSLEILCFNGCYAFCQDTLKEAIINCCIRCPVKHVLFSNTCVNLTFLESILRSCRTLKKLRVRGPIHDQQNNDYQDIIDRLTDIASKLKNKPEFDYDLDEINLNRNGNSQVHLDVNEALYDQLNA